MSKRKRKKAEWAREQTKEVVGFDVQEVMSDTTQEEIGSSSVWSRERTKEVTGFDAGGFMEQSSAFEREATREVLRPDWTQDAWQVNEDDEANFFGQSFACA